MSEIDNNVYLTINTNDRFNRGIFQTSYSHDMYEENDSDSDRTLEHGEISTCALKILKRVQKKYKRLQQSSNVLERKYIRVKMENKRPQKLVSKKNNSMKRSTKRSVKRKINTHPRWRI